MKTGSAALSALLLTLAANLVGCAADSTPRSTFSEADDVVATYSPALATPAAAEANTNPVGSGEVAEATFVNAGGGSIALSDGTSIYVPVGSLASERGTLTLTSSTQPASSAITTVTPTYSFGPTDATFAKPVRITILLAVPKGATADDLTIYLSRPGGGGFEAVPTTFVMYPPSADDPRNALAFAEVQRFGVAGVGFKPMPDRGATVSPN